MSSSKVLVYSTPSCPYCVRAKRYLAEKGVKYTDIDVSKNSEQAQKMVKKSGQMGVPVIEINGNIIVGFNQSKIDYFLNK